MLRSKTISPRSETPSKVAANQLIDLDLLFALSEISDDGKADAMAEEMLEHIAHLSKLNIEDDEKTELARNLTDIIAFADQLATVEMGDIDPLSYIIDNSNVFRNDEVKSSLPVEEVLKNASVKKGDYFYVPQSI